MSETLTECSMCLQRVTVDLIDGELLLDEGIRVTIHGPKHLCAPCFEKSMGRWFREFDVALVSWARIQRALFVRRAIEAGAE